MLPIISYNGTCRFPVREQAFLLMETTVPFKGNCRFLRGMMCTGFS